MKNRNIYWRRWKIQETLYIRQWHLSPLQSRHLGTSHSSNCHQWPCHSFLNLIQVLKSFFLSKVILVLGKARSLRVLNLGSRGAESPGWFDVSQNSLHEAWCVSQVHCCDEAASHQLPIPVAFWIIWIVSAEECSSLMQNFMQIHWSTCLVILNETPTQYICSLNGVYHPPD